MDYISELSSVISIILKTSFAILGTTCLVVALGRVCYAISEPLATVLVALAGHFPARQQERHPPAPLALGQTSPNNTSQPAVLGTSVARSSVTILALSCWFVALPFEATRDQQIKGFPQASGAEASEWTLWKMGFLMLKAAFETFGVMSVLTVVVIGVRRLM